MGHSLFSERALSSPAGASCPLDWRLPQFLSSVPHFARFTSESSGSAEHILQLYMSLASQFKDEFVNNLVAQFVGYASTAYVERLLSVEAHISMSAVGNPYDNAKAESFFKTLKQEEVYLKQYQTFEEAQTNIGQFIEEV